MQTQITLQMPTGNGNTALAANCGSINPIYQPLLDIAFQGQTIGDYHNLDADRCAQNLLTPAIDNLRQQRGNYAGLTPLEQGYRLQVLEFLTQWRDKCREHPQAIVSVIP